RNRWARTRCTGWPWVGSRCRGGRSVGLGELPARRAVRPWPVRGSSLGSGGGPSGVDGGGEGEFGPDQGAQPLTEGEVHHRATTPAGGQMVDEQQAPAALGLLPLGDGALVRDVREGRSVGAGPVIDDAHVQGV